MPQPATALTPPGSDGTNLNLGNPYTNGDLSKSTGGYWILNVSTIQVDVIDDIGYRPAPSWDLPLDLLYNFDMAPTADYEWGLSDFHYHVENTTSYNQRGINFTLPDILHCIQHNNTTTVEGVQRFAALYLVSMTEDNGVYTGKFLFWVRSFEPHDQATAGTEFVTIRWVDYGALRITKTSADPATTTGNRFYSLDGARYGVYQSAADAQADKNSVTVMTLAGDGVSAVATANKLSGGLYYIKELSAPEGYELDPTIRSVTVVPGQIADLAAPQVTDVPRYCQIDLQKQSGNPALSGANGCYSLSGAVYTVYSNAAATQKVTSITTDATGYGKTTPTLPAGSYWVKETTPATGYALDPTIYALTVKPGDTGRVNNGNGGVVKDLPQNNPLKIVVEKIDIETTADMPLGGASLAGAQFEVKYYAGYYTASNLPSAALRTWILQTGSDGTAALSKTALVGGDVLYTSSTGAATLPLGTVTVQEIKAPEGYLLGKRPVFVRQITGVGTAEPVSTYVAPRVPDQVKRGDLELLKAVAVTYKRMAGIPFSITSASTKESHIIVTDANGHADTSNAWNPHSQNTNAGKTDEDGVWFGIDRAGNVAPVDDALGALPYDTYLIEELPCAANADYQLIPAFEVTISRDTYVADLGTLTDIAPAIPEIGTQAKDADSGTQNVIAAKEVTVVDTVSYKNLEVGREYRIEGVLMDQSSETTVVVAGHPVVAEASFSPVTPQGTVEVTFNFDASALDGARIVIFESLLIGKKIVATHADINNASQTLQIISPLIRTTATKQGSDAKTIPAGSPVTITDTVLYSNLTAGKTYTLHGTLMDKTAAEPVIAAGKELSATRTFTPESSSGVVTLDFSFDARTLGGHDVVVFEAVSYNGAEVAVHADINDAGQTVKILTPAPAPTPEPTPTPTPESTPTPTPVTPKPKSSPIPSTGDMARPVIALTLLVSLSAVVLIVVLLRRRRLS